MITNATQIVVENTLYLPYGEVDSGGTAEDKLYEGKILDSSGQYYFGARYYNPETALFTQPDSLIPNIYDPQQLNIYSFERNSPYNYVDPSGHFAIQIGLRGTATLNPFSSSGSMGYAYVSNPLTGEVENRLYKSAVPLGLGRLGAGLSGVVEVIITPEATKHSDIEGVSSSMGGFGGYDLAGGYEYAAPSDIQLASHTILVGAGEGIEVGVSKHILLPILPKKHIQDLSNIYLPCLINSLKARRNEQLNNKYSSNLRFVAFVKCIWFATISLVSTISYL